MGLQFYTCMCQKGLSNEKIFKLLSELSENDSCNKNTSNDDKNFDINDQINWDENAHKILQQ